MTRAFLALLLFTLATPAVLHADALYLKDGSTLVGKVTKVFEGKVNITTDFAGELTIDAEKIAGIKTDEPLTVHLESGERAVGALEYDPATQQQRVTGELAGPVATPIVSVARAWPAGAADPAIAAAEAEAARQRGKWAVHMELGINGQTGNSEIVNVNGRGSLKRTTPNDRLTIYAQGRLSRDNGETTAREILGGAKYEVDITKRLFAYGGFELENDEFEMLDLRVTVTGGLGYFIIREENTELKFRAGLGFQHESFQDGTDSQEPIGELGIDFQHDINEWLRFTHSTTVYPVLDDFGEFRAVMENAAELPLSSDKMWKLRLGIRNQYDSEPAGGADRLDTFYFANVGVDF